MRTIEWGVALVILATSADALAGDVGKRCRAHLRVLQARPEDEASTTIEIASA